MKEKVLVIGANGNTGRRVVQEIMNSEKYEVIPMVRKQPQLEKFRSMGLNPRYGDLEEDFDNVFMGIDKVIFAAGSGSFTGDDMTVVVDKEGAIASIDSSLKHGIKKFVMLSSMGTDMPDQVPGLTTYLKAKKAADDYLKESGVKYTIIQPGGLTDHEGCGKVQVSEKLNKFGKISRDDVALVLVKALDDSCAANCCFELLEGDQDVDTAVESI